MVSTTGNAAGRAVASAGALALLALAALASLGKAQVVRRDPVAWARTASVATRAVNDTIGGRRGDIGDSVRVETDSLAASIQSTADSMVRSAPQVRTFRSRADSLRSVQVHLAADRDNELRIVVSLNDRKLWALIGPDTLLTAPVAVSTDETLSYAGKSWTFETPRGVRTVLAKRENPVWIPPDWHYAEVASEEKLKLEPMKPGKTMLSDGNWLEVRNNDVGLVNGITREFAVLPVDEEIIFDNTLFIPPVGTKNRRIEGELGRHMLDTGDGFLLHGTPHKATIGTAATHGCIRLRDEDIQWLYDMIPVGTHVYIY
jgi:lipoprotein-anchoring transpeptidase ErfK/SrfK